MSDRDSTTGGPLDVVPGPSAEATEDVLGDLLAGLTGLDRQLVRPRWQPDPPKQPEASVDWCAFGVAEAAPEAAQLIHGDDVARLHTEELVTVPLSFYGPRAADLAKAVRAGLRVPANRALLRRHSLALVAVGPAVPAPDLVGGAWIRRIDMPLTIRQGTPITAGAVQIRNILSAPTTITGDTHE